MNVQIFHFLQARLRDHADLPEQLKEENDAFDQNINAREAFEFDEVHIAVASDLDMNNNKRDVGTQTDMTIDELAKSLEYLSLFESDNHTLRKRINLLIFDQKTFLNNDSRTRYYTGLHSKTVPLLTGTLNDGKCFHCLLLLRSYK